MHTIITILAFFCYMPMSRSGTSRSLTNTFMVISFLAPRDFLSCQKWRKTKLPFWYIIFLISPLIFQICLILGLEVSVADAWVCVRTATYPRPLLSMWRDQYEQFAACYCIIALYLKVAIGKCFIKPMYTLLTHKCTDKIWPCISAVSNAFSNWQINNIFLRYSMHTCWLSGVCVCCMMWCASDPVTH